MRLSLGLAVVAIGLLGTSRVGAADGGLTPGYLRCEYLVDPLGIDVRAPRLSWIVEATARGQQQTAYQVLVAGDRDALTGDRGDLWDSGRVASGETSAIVYAGKPLRSHQPCYWKVRVWDKDAKPSAWSRPALWTMGLLDPSDWGRAEWIGSDRARKAEPQGGLILPPPSYLRDDFRVEQPVRQATLHATGLGIFDVHLNGRRISDDWFNPGWTDYTKRAYYRAYDVTDRMRTGENTLGAIVADGWYSGYVGFGKKRDHYGTKPRFRALLHLELADGTTRDIVTGPDWKASTGPILESDFLMGETYDARKAMPGWDAPGFDASGWHAVDVGTELKPIVQWHPGPPVRAFAELKPKSIAEPKPGTYVLDLGQNFAGVVRLKASGEPGRKIALRFAERLNPDGTIYTTNLREARATDTYSCNGHDETWEPRFTFHGFQYVEVTGLKSRPAEDTITGVAISSDTPVVGSFACSDPMLNQLFSNIYWTQRANFIDIPTDCPQRDERLGWTGDAQVYIETASLICDVQAFFNKWLVDLTDGQRADGQFPMVAPVKVAGNDGGPAWADAGVICPWTIYKAYGDRRVLERQYPSMVKFVEFCRKRCTPDLLPPKQFHCFGDWLSINADTPRDVIFTAYFARSALLTSMAAEALGKTEDAAKYRELADRVRDSFRRAYIGLDGRIKGNTQAVYAMAIDFVLVGPDRSDPEFARAAHFLAEDIERRGNHLSTGFVGTRSLMPALSMIGRDDVAFRLLHNDTFPSWGFSIKQGATSIWERWDGWTPQKGFQDPGMNSFAHYSFGAVYGWIAHAIGGIGLATARNHLLIVPRIDPNLTWARTSYRSRFGTIATAWQRDGGRLSLEVTIPANCQATVWLPIDAREITESGRPVAQAEGVSGPLNLPGDPNPGIPFSVEPGTYRFAMRVR